MTGRKDRDDHHQIVGAGTMELDTVEEGGFLQDLVGRWGKPVRQKGSKKVAR